MNGSRRIYRVSVLILLLVLASSACASDPGATDPGPSVTPLASAAEPTASPTAEPSVAPPGALDLSWTEVPFDGRIAAVVADGSRFVAVGSGAERTSAWTSTDGLTWQQHDVPDKSLLSTDDVELWAGMGPLVRLGDTLYSFGSVNFMDAWNLVGWRWTDGVTWELIESESPFYGSGIVTALTSSDEALLAAKTSFDSLRGTVAAWLWTAASSWVKTDLASSDAEDIYVGDVTWDAGRYIAVGDVGFSDGGTDRDAWPRAPSIWTSSDGRAWSRVEPPEATASVCSVVAMPPGGFAAFGRTGDRHAVWTSPDGGEWIEGIVQAPGPDVHAGDGLAGPCGVMAVGGGMLAVAITEETTLTWTSIDGRTWTFRGELDISGVQPANMASLGDVVLVIGYQRDSQEEGGYRLVLLRGSSD